MCRRHRYRNPVHSVLCPSKRDVMRTIEYIKEIFKVEIKLLFFVTGTHFHTDFHKANHSFCRQREKKMPHSNRSNETNNKLSYCIEIYLLYFFCLKAILRHLWAIQLIFESFSFGKYKLIWVVYAFKIWINIFVAKQIVQSVRLFQLCPLLFSLVPVAIVVSY